MYVSNDESSEVQAQPNNYESDSLKIVDEELDKFWLSNNWGVGLNVNENDLLFILNIDMAKSSV